MTLDNSLINDPFMYSNSPTMYTMEYHNSPPIPAYYNNGYQCNMMMTSNNRMVSLRLEIRV